MSPPSAVATVVPMKWWRWALIGADTVVAVSATAAIVLMRPVSGWWVWCLAGLLGLPLALRVVWPARVLGVVLVAAGLTVVVGVGAEVSVYAVAYALYTVALSPARWALPASLASVLLPGLAVVLVPGLPLVPAGSDGETFSNAPVTVAVYSTAVIGGSWALALALRLQREHTSLQAARAMAEERLRIARDVHDVVGHNLSLIAMKAAVANHLETDRKAALHTIEQVSRTALEEVRAVLGDLRTSIDLDQLLDETRASGVEVTLERDNLTAVPARVRVSAHWILREALTNVRRHAAASRCHVSVTAEPGVLRLSVVDNGPGGRDTGSGSVVRGGVETGSGPDAAAAAGVGTMGLGLVGMGERTALHEGTLTAAPQPGGGFAVLATLRFAS